jgi:hypothetical protein
MGLEDVRGLPAHRRIALDLGTGSVYMTFTGDYMVSDTAANNKGC